MNKHKAIGRTFLFCITMCVVMVFIRRAAGDQTEILKITVGEPTKLSNLVNQNTASLAISQTGVVAVFYPKPRTGPRFYRTSLDLGETWSKEMDSPPLLAGGSATATLRDGGVLKFLCTESSF